ncbi:MAG: hypothetical protein L6Q47_11660 [Ignavibacteriaceae bacterium]|nr:hypothetical protein [Ignavibacteriaceae bacterium]
MNIELFTALTAIFTSVAAILLNLWVIKIQITHNYKSVKPLAFVDIFDYQDQTSISILNSGMGPMIITRICFYDGHQKIEDINKLFPFNEMKFKNYNPEIIGTVIVPGDSVNLIDFRADKTDSQSISHRDFIRNKLGNFTLEIDFVDIYDRKQKGQKRNLSIFHRETNWNL